MNRPAARHELPLALLVPILLGAVLALAGGYWDDAWHTERGRDQFLSAPHLAIYGGVSLAGGALGLWLAVVIRSQGLHAVRSQRSLLLALIGVAATLASAPIDNAWHVAFGRDAVIWSPPHALGIVGTATLGVAVLLELASGERAWARYLQPVAGAFVLAAFNFLVVEYETDVPQFDPMWYLPVLAAFSALALGVVRLLSEAPWAATAAAALQLVFTALVGLFLLALGYDAPKLPLLIGPALVLDICWRAALPWPLRAPLFVAILYLLYVPTLNSLGSGVTLELEDVLLGLPLALAATELVLAALFARRLGPSGRLASVPTGALSVGALLALAAPALAHDPGQGEDAGAMRLHAEARGHRVTLSAAPRSACARFHSGEVVARRAGETLRAPMDRDGCRFRGQLRVSDEGRWFVYAELNRAGETVESWLPLEVGSGPEHVSDPDRYAYIAERPGDGVLRILAGIVLYALMVGLLAAIVALVRADAAAGSGRVPAPQR
jgi:hypothetical protein